MAKSVLITGASGFIGMNLVKAIQNHYQIYLQARGKSSIPATFKSSIIDFSKTLNLNRMKFTVDKIIHLAGEFEKKKDFKKLYFANTYSTYLLTQWAAEKGIGEFILASSGGVYGWGRHRETDPPHPVDLYALTKRQAEEIILWSSVKKAKIARMFFCYGPGTERGLIIRLIKKVLRKEEIIVDRLMINPIYIDDLIEFLKRLVRSSQGGIYNLAGDDEIMLSDLVDLIGSITKKKVKMRRGIDKGELIGMTTKAKRELNYKPKINLKTGLEITYESMVGSKGQ